MRDRIEATRSGPSCLFHRRQETLAQPVGERDRLEGLHVYHHRDLAGLEHRAALDRGRVLQVHRRAADLQHVHRDGDALAVVDRREELDLDLRAREAEAFLEDQRIGLADVAREEVLERDVQEVDEPRVIRDSRRVQVPEADEDRCLEQG